MLIHKVHECEAKIIASINWFIHFNSSLVPILSSISYYRKKGSRILITVNNLFTNFSLIIILLGCLISEKDFSH